MVSTDNARSDKETGTGMRVAIVTETFLPATNGIVRALLAYLDYLKEHGHEAIVFAPGDGPTEYTGFEVVRVQGTPFPAYPEVIVAPYSIHMRPKLEEFKPDMMHLAGPFALGKQGLDVARERGIPVAAHYQTDMARYATHFGMGAFADVVWRQLLDIHNAADVSFAPTTSVIDDLHARGMLNVSYSGRGIDTVLFNPGKRDETLRARFGGSDDRPILLYVGRVSVEKGLDTLKAAATALPHLPLAIVGDGPARAGLEKEIGGRRNVFFTGVLHGEELAAHYASADLFVFPSTTETFGQVVREAMASGLASVGVRAGGVQDLIRDGETGTLCPPDDEAAFVAAVAALASDGGTRRRYGAEARRETESYSWNAVFDTLMEQYAALIARTSATVGA